MDCVPQENTPETDKKKNVSIRVYILYYFVISPIPAHRIEEK